VNGAAPEAEHLLHPIRIAFSLDSMGIGGTELNVLRLATRLDLRRFSLVVLYNRDGPLMPQFEAAGLRLHRLELTSLKSPQAVGAANRLRSWLQREEIDVLHAHDIYTNILGAMAVPRAGNTRLILSRRWGATQYPRLLTTVNRFAYRRADLVLANSDGVATSLQMEEGVPADQIAVVSNFVDTSVFAPGAAIERATLRARLGVPLDALVIGTVANLRPVKDQATLLRAVASLPTSIPPVHVVLIGEGPSRPDLEGLAHELGITGRVHFVGAIMNAFRYHHAFDVSVLSSVSEGFPNTLVEAMAASRPVVATRVGGVPDAVREGETGYLVPTGNYVAFAERLGRLLTDPHHRAQMGRAGYEIAIHQFHEASVIPRLERIYRQLKACTEARKR
jgi:glycosyltransferase involved in cell wall biosynthesis